MYQHL